MQIRDQKLEQIKAQLRDLKRAQARVDELLRQMDLRRQRTPFGT